MSKKVICFVLIIAMVCLCLAGCGTAGTNSTISDGSATGDTSSTEDPFAVVSVNDRPTHDLGGKEFTIVTWDAHMFSYVEGESDYGDEVLKRIANVETELNCKLNFKILDPTTQVSALAAAQLSGDKLCDLILPILHQAPAFITGGLVTDLNRVPTLDLTKLYWNDKGTEFGNLEGNQYFAICRMVQSEEQAWTISFNKRLISEMGMESPYDLMKSNEWTVSKMREMAKTATKEMDGISGMSANDQWGIAAVDASGQLGLATLTAMGAQFIQKDSKGTFQYMMGTKNVQDAISYVHDWLANDNSIYRKDDVSDVWEKGHALFYSNTFKSVTSYSKNMVDDYGLVPFPRGDNQTEYAMDMDWNRSVMCVPSGLSSEDLDDTGYLMDSLAYYSQPEYVAKWNEYKERYTCDDESKAVIDSLFKYTGFNYSQLVASNGNDALKNATYQIYYDTMNKQGYNLTDGIAANIDAGKTALITWIQSLQK